MMFERILHLFAMFLILAKGQDSASNFYYEHWCGGQLQYLDDRLCAKHFPEKLDRDFSCRSRDFKEETSSAPTFESILHDVDESALSSVLTPPSSGEELDLCVIIIDDTGSSDYYCYGSSSALTPHETWSSSKIFSVSNAASKLRETESNLKCELGLNSYVRVKGNQDPVPLGDLITIVTSYDKTANYTSNSLSSYFNDIGFRERLDEDILHDWFGAPKEFSLGGNYGEPTPSDLSFVLDGCQIDKDAPATTYENSISALAAAEMLRRIVLYREITPDERFPGVTWDDIQHILYGAGEQSLFFPGQGWGGMTADTAIFVQSALEARNVSFNDPEGKWRIFSKLGAGYSSSRRVGEIWTSAYACVPGGEFILAARGSVVSDPSLVVAQSLVKKAVDETIAWIVK
mgnify:CR=1 FL=1